MESKKEFKTPSLGYSAFVLAALAISTFVRLILKRYNVFKLALNDTPRDPAWIHL